MRDIIICLIGESGSGKTTIAKEMHNNGFNVIQSYTTRPPRKKNEWGHIFKTKKDIEKEKKIHYDPNVINLDQAISLTMQTSKDVITYAYYKNNHYWATFSQYKNKGVTCYVVDWKGYELLKKKITDANIISIHLKASEDVRKSRMVERYLKDNNNESSKKIFENAQKSAIERIDNDKLAFKNIKCNYVIDANQNIDSILRQINKIINNINKREE